MRADDESMPGEPELERTLSNVRPVVLDHARRPGKRGVPIRTAALAIGALVIFGGGVSLGSAFASPAPIVTNPALHTLKVACFDDPTSTDAFAYINVSVMPGAPDGSPAANCDRVWDESAQLSAVKASLSFTEQQYEQGVCASRGAINCYNDTITPPPVAAVKPANWADCSRRAGYFVEVGYSSGTAPSACRAQSLGTR